MKDALLKQHRQWEEVFKEEPDLYGVEPSIPAQNAAELFKREKAGCILELGGGQGRDTLYFARQGFRVTVLEYTESGIDAIKSKAATVGMSTRVNAIRHDVRVPLPFEDTCFDGCFSHMLYCMALTTADLIDLSREILRILKPGGYHIYTVRNTHDSHYGMGAPRGEDMYENDGFIVHFFSRDKVITLAKGFEIKGIDEFEEGELPRRLFQVTLKKNRE